MRHWTIVVRSCLFAALISWSSAWSQSDDIATQSNGYGSQGILSRLGSNASPTVWVSELGKALEDHPDDRLARYYRAQIFMNMGRVSEARSDLDQLAAEGFSSSALTPIKADLAHMTDARDEEISAYERECQPLAPDDPVAKDPTAEASWLDGSKLASIRIKELRGDQKAAEEGWQKWLQEDDNAKFGMNEYGEYHIRQGNFEAAIKDFAACLAAMPKNQPSVDVTANVGLRLAEALWASGKLEEAEKRAAQVLELLREHKESTGRVSAFLAPSVFITLALAQQGFGVIDDKTSATLALSELVTAMKEEEYYGNGNIVAVLAGKLSKDKAANQLEKILKVAPNLDWALWSEMYLGFATAEDGQRALKFMPEHSLQRAILAQYLKGTSN